MTGKASSTRPSGCRRRNPRISTRFRANLQSVARSERGTLVDLSVSGARFIMDDDAVKLRSFREWRDVLLKWGDFEAFGTIRWRRKEAFGLRFDPSITPFILRATRAQEDEISIRVT